MKRVMYCFLLFAVTSVVCLIAGYGLTRYSVRQERAVPNTVIETETVNDMDEKTAMNQEQIKRSWRPAPRRRSIIWCQRRASFWYSAATAVPSASIPTSRRLISRNQSGKGF